MSRIFALLALLLLPTGAHAAPAPSFDVEFSSSSRYLPPTPTGYSPTGKPVWQSTEGCGERNVTLGSYSTYFGDASDTPAANPFSVAGGVMTLTLQPGAHPAAPSWASQPLPYVGGMLDSCTLPGGTFTGARIEVRAKWPAAGPQSGLWPAIWLGAVSGAWPPEIDVMEALGQDPPTAVHVTTHYGPNGQDNGSLSQIVNASSPTSGWHIYGVDFDSTKPGSTITFFIDDKAVATAPMTGSLAGAGPYYLMINNAAGGTGQWPCAGVAGCPTIKAPIGMQIDSVRIYAPGTVLP